jgi:hypothetical protein
MITLLNVREIDWINDYMFHFFERLTGKMITCLAVRETHGIKDYLVDCSRD